MNQPPNTTKDKAQQVVDLVSEIISEQIKRVVFPMNNGHHFENIEDLKQQLVTLLTEEK